MNRTLRLLCISLASGCIFFNYNVISFAGSIHRAVEKNDIEKVREILSADSKVVSEKNDKDINNNLPLPIHIAASYDEPQIIELLVSNGADVNSRNQRKETPLHLAAACGSLNAAAALLKLSADVNATCKTGLTPLHTALNKPFEMAKLLIKYGASVNARDNGRQTPLHNAASLGNSDLMELLIKTGADAKAADQFNYNALHIIAMQPERTIFAGGKIIVDVETNRGDVKNMILLLNAGIDINARVGDASSGNAPIHLAARAGRLYVIEELLNRKANIDSVNKEGDTPLHYLLKETPFVLPDMDYKEAEEEIRKFKDKQIIVFKFLIHKGADLNIENNSTDTVLDIAESQNFEELVKLLREAGAKKGKFKNNNFPENPSDAGTIISSDAAGPNGSQSEYVSLKTSGNCGIRDVIEKIGTSAGIIIVLERSVTGMIDVEFKDVYYETALKTIAENNGLTMSKSGNVYKFAKNK